MVQLKGLFKLAPSLAIKYFKNKNNKLSWDWYELWQDAHKKSFTVAKVMREDILKDIRSALDKALSEYLYEQNTKHVDMKIHYVHGMHI